MPRGVMVAGRDDYLNVVGKSLEKLRGYVILFAYIGYSEFIELLGVDAHAIDDVPRYNDIFYAGCGVSALGWADLQVHPVNEFVEEVGSEVL